LAALNSVQALTRSHATERGLPEAGDLLYETGRHYLEMGLLMWRLDPEWADALLNEWQALHELGARRGGETEEDIQRFRQVAVANINDLKQIAQGIADGSIEPELP
jgi:hypothetical protein